MRETRFRRSALILACASALVTGSAACTGETGYDDALWCYFIGSLYFDAHGVVGGDESALYGTCFAELESVGDVLWPELAADFRAYSALHDAAGPTAPAPPSPAAFMAARYPDWETRRESLRTRIELPHRQPGRTIQR